jgi:hypothetical protein
MPQQRGRMSRDLQKEMIGWLTAKQVNDLLTLHRNDPKVSE